MNTKDKALKLALEVLESERDKYLDWGDEDGAPEDVYDAITAIKQALAAPAQTSSDKDLTQIDFGGDCDTPPEPWSDIWVAWNSEDGFTFWDNEKMATKWSAHDSNEWPVQYAMQKAQPAAPEGWKLVPVEPTKEMWDAVNKLDDQCAGGNYDGKGCSIEQAWDCLLAAAPEKGQP